MKEKRAIPINVINLTVIITVMFFVALLTQNIIKELTIRDIQNVTRLTNTNIYAEINKELIEPINSSIIMAQNTLFLDFMNQDTEQTEAKMAEYLTAIQEVTGYESVFLTPDSTLNYYYPGGTEAKVDIESAQAYWYTNRIDAEDSYGIVVNTEQLDNWALTLYVDANINDRNGNFAGVTGVGKRIEKFQSILSSYLDKQGVEGYIVDSDGMIKVHKDNNYIKSTSLYELENISAESIDIEKSKVQPIEKMIGNRFFIIQHIPVLNWYLVVRKSSSELTRTLDHYSGQIMMVLILAALVMLFVTNYAISMYKKQIIYLSNIDHLTAISNRTIFDNALKDGVKNIENQKFCLVLFDLDNLKKINDEFGHARGDESLKLIAELAENMLEFPDFVSRVGGDEFAVLIYKHLEEAKTSMNKFQNIINSNSELQSVGGTISIGITECDQSDIESTVYKRADKALYKSKKDGKNRITIL